MRFRKRPVEVEAVQWTGDNLGAVLGLLDRSATREIATVDGTSDLEILTLEGTMTARPGDWIIRGVANEIYPCEPAIFAVTYDAVL